MKMNENIVERVLGRFPDVEAIYLFGSYDTQDELPGSDIDIAMLLPPETVLYKIFHIIPHGLTSHNGDNYRTLRP